jgi:type IV pilus assembly protein PilP
VKSKAGIRVICAVVLASCAAAGCSGGQSDLQKWIADTKKKPGGRIQALPEVKPYESFVYAAGNLRSPFQPVGPGGGVGPAGLRPSSQRNREFLEGFSLDTMKMVGTFKVGGRFYGLVQSKDGLVHKIQPGNYLGQNDGKVTEISGSKIRLVEIIPDGLGGYIERPASLSLTD